MHPKPPHIALALAALLALPLSAGEVKEKAADKPAAPATEAAMKIHVDPATGQVVSKAAPGARTTATAMESAAPLKVEKVTTKAGGKKVNLQGRFMMEMAATAGPDGTVSHGCDQGPGPAAAPVKEHRHDR